MLHFRQVYILGHKYNVKFVYNVASQLLGCPDLLTFLMRVLYEQWRVA